MTIGTVNPQSGATISKGSILYFDNNLGSVVTRILLRRDGFLDETVYTSNAGFLPDYTGTRNLGNGIEIFQFSRDVGWLETPIQIVIEIDGEGATTILNYDVAGINEYPTFMIPWGGIGGGGSPVFNKYLNDLLDVNAPTPADTEVLAWDAGTSRWVPRAPSLPGAHVLDSHTDVTIAGATNGQVLTYSNGTWVNADATGGGGSSTFEDLTDTPAYAGNALKLLRVNAAATGIEYLTNSYVTGPASSVENQIALYSSGTGKALKASTVTIDLLNNMNIGSVSASNFLRSTNELVLAETGIPINPITSGYGYLWVSSTDGRLKYVSGDQPGTIHDLLATGSGDVSGPASSADNQLALFNGTSGKVIKNSTATIGALNDFNIAIVNASGWIRTDNEIRFREATSLQAPATGFGSLFVDTDNHLKYMDEAGSVLDISAIGAGGGTGDVTGPASSTDNAIARYNGTGGKTIQNSAVTIDDLGGVDGTSFRASQFLRTANEVVMYRVAQPALVPGATYGQLWVDSADDKIKFTAPGGSPTYDLTSGTGGGGTWGSITGTLSDQTDLQSALNNKSDTSHGHSNFSTTGSTPGFVPGSSGQTTRFLRGDGTWQVPVGSGDVVGPASSTVNQIALFADGTGKVIKNSTVTIGLLNDLTAAIVIGTGFVRTDNEIRFKEATSLQAPTAGWGSLYVDTDNHLKYLNEAGSVLDISAMEGTGATTFIGLGDTDPASYAGAAGRTVRVNSGETGLEFGNQTWVLPTANDPIATAQDGDFWVET